MTLVNPTVALAALAALVLNNATTRMTKKTVFTISLLTSLTAGGFFWHQLTQSQPNQPKTSSHYEQWVNNNHAELNAYEQYLAKHGVANIVSMRELSLAARAENHCAIELQYEIPPTTKWPAIVPTLKLVRELKQLNRLSDAHDTSGFRSVEANTCSGGASKSRHLTNGALDFDIPNQPNLVKKICDYWLKNGKAQNFGLGLYDETHIHIDTLGFRTWGYSYSRDSSLCIKPANPS